MPMFASATRKKLKLRMAIDGPSGSGKTYTALRAATALGTKIVAIDTEHGSMAKYEGESPDGVPWKWQVCELTHFDPQNYTLAIGEAKKLNPDVLIIDSLSHALEGIGGALEQVSKASGNKYTAWKDVTPKHQKMVQAILSFPAHVIVTMRSKMEHVLEENPKGKMVPRKVGMAPIQRPGMEYEFDVVVELDWDHNLLVTKTRCSAIDGMRVEKPGPEFMQPIIKWLNDGAEYTQPAVSQKPVTTTTAATPSASSQELMAGAFEGTAPVEASVAADREMITPEQSQLIKDLATQLGMKREQLLAVLAKRGGKVLAELTSVQAAELISGMMKKLDAKTANPT